MRLPINVQNLTFIAVSQPEAVVDFDSKQPRSDTDGRPIFAVGVVALGSEGADILTVKVAGLPRVIGNVEEAPERVVEFEEVGRDRARAIDEVISGLDARLGLVEVR